MEIDGIPIPKDYKSPLQERGESEQDAPPRVLPTRKAFLEYVNEGTRSTNNVSVYGRNVWCSEHTVRDGRKLVRMHLIDLFALVSEEILKSKYEDQYDNNRYIVDKDLMAATIWKNNDNEHDLPLRGQKVKVVYFTDPKVFRNECCQFTTRFGDLKFEKKSEKKSETTSTTDGKYPISSSTITEVATVMADSSSNVCMDKSATATEDDDEVSVKLEPPVKKKKTD